VIHTKYKIWVLYLGGGFLCLKDILEEFILELEMQNYSQRTIKAYRNSNLMMFTLY